MFAIITRFTLPVSLYYQGFRQRMSTKTVDKSRPTDGCGVSGKEKMPEVDRALKNSLAIDIDIFDIEQK
jgi:hypothetical protein